VGIKKENVGEGKSSLTLGDNLGDREGKKVMVAGRKKGRLVRDWKSIGF